MTMKKKITVKGMSCMHCAARVETALVNIGGRDVSVNLAEGVVLGFFDAADDAIRQAVEKIGFLVVSIDTLA